jgi:hypothetical protein
VENRHRPKIVALRAPADFRLAHDNGDNAMIARDWGQDAEPIIGREWPAGWWILPFAAGGLIETITLVLWFGGQL